MAAAAVMLQSLRRRDLSSPNLRSINEDNPGILHDEALRSAKLLHAYGAVSKTHMEIVVEPVGKEMMKVKDKVKKQEIEVPNNSQFAQSPWSISDLQYKLCGNVRHTSLLCTEAPDAEFDFDLGPRCYCCGQFGHITLSCPALNKSSSPMPTPTQIITSQESSSQTPLKRVSWNTVLADLSISVGPSVGPTGPKVEPTT